MLPVLVQIESERRAVVRQSSAAILDASSDAKLAKAFEQIEQLSKELGDAKTKIKYHVRSAPSAACYLCVATA